MPRSGEPGRYPNGKHRNKQGAATGAAPGRMRAAAPISRRVKVEKTYRGRLPVSGQDKPQDGR